MPTIQGYRHHKRSHHSSVTVSASKVYSELLAKGFVSYPGVISAKGGKGGVRITLTYEPTRTRITVVGTGSQELLLYGNVDRDKLQKILEDCATLSFRVRTN